MKHPLSLHPTFALRTGRALTARHILAAIFTFTFNLHPLPAATPVNVTYDENGSVTPAAAKATLDRACSAVVAVDLATAKAEILTNVATIANGTMAEANALLTKHTDFVVIDTFATGIEDARGSTNTATTASIAIISNPVITDTATTKEVTLSWAYTGSGFEEPTILASTSLATNASFATVWQGEPEQFEWGTTNAYRATASLPKSTYGSQAFFRIAAQVVGPVDDGQTFDTYEDGTDYWIEFYPTNHFRVRIINGKWTTIQKLN